MKADKKTIAIQLLRLKKAFPNQPQDFFDVLMERIEFYEFTIEELNAAVNTCIDTFEYKSLTVAAVLKSKLDSEVKPTIVD
mgnify:FL=1